MSDQDHLGPSFDKLYREYVLKNVVRTVRMEMLEAVQRQWEIAELEQLWKESE